MENAEEILQSLEEFSKVKPKNIPRELEEYLLFVAKTGDPIYQWPVIKCLFREKLVNVITEFYEQCPSIEIPPCPNVDVFNYDSMKNFILEKLDTFAAAPFTVQRICELLTTPRKEYNRIDKYMRALEKNILVVSTREPGNRRNTENGESEVNGLENEHITSDINVEVEMDDISVYTNQNVEKSETKVIENNFISAESKPDMVAACSSSIDTVINRTPISYMSYTAENTIIATSDSQTTEADPSLGENSGILQQDNLTVTQVVQNSTPITEDLGTLEDQNKENETTIYLSAYTHDSAIYLGTGKKATVYGYMLPKNAFPQEGVYENPEIKAETSSSHSTVQVGEPSDKIIEPNPTIEQQLPPETQEMSLDQPILPTSEIKITSDPQEKRNWEASPLENTSNLPLPTVQAENTPEMSLEVTKFNEFTNELNVTPNLETANQVFEPTTFEPLKTDLNEPKLVEIEPSFHETEPKIQLEPHTDTLSQNQPHLSHIEPKSNENAAPLSHIGADPMPNEPTVTQTGAILPQNEAIPSQIEVSQPLKGTQLQNEALSSQNSVLSGQIEAVSSQSTALLGQNEAGLSQERAILGQTEVVSSLLGQNEDSSTQIEALSSQKELLLDQSEGMQAQNVPMSPMEATITQIDASMAPNAVQLPQNEVALPQNEVAMLESEVLNPSESILSKNEVPLVQEPILAQNEAQIEVDLSEKVVQTPNEVVLSPNLSEMGVESAEKCSLGLGEAITSQTGVALGQIEAVQACSSQNEAHLSLIETNLGDMDQNEANLAHKEASLSQNEASLVQNEANLAQNEVVLPQIDSQSDVSSQTAQIEVQLDQPALISQELVQKNESLSAESDKIPQIDTSCSNLEQKSDQPMDQSESQSVICDEPMDVDQNILVLEDKTDKNIDN